MLKAIKLLYLSDRCHLRKYAFPITNDKYVSMPHGPVNSISLNLINGQLFGAGWDEFIGDRADHDVGLRRQIAEDDLDELSEAEIESLQEVWAQFGHMDQWQLSQWTHDNCPEWEDPNGSSNPIPYERLLKFLGFENATLLANEIKSVEHADKIFAKLRP